MSEDYMRRCDTCRHWNGPKEESDAGPEPYMWGDCRLSVVDRSGGVVTACTWTETRSTFGCVLWESEVSS